MVKVTKTFTNQYIIGKTETKEDQIIITDPYMIIPDPAGIQMFPYDEAILGVKVTEIQLSKIQTLYSQEPAETIKQLYLKDKTGIETADKIII